MKKEGYPLPLFNSQSDIGFDSPPPNYSNDDSGDRNSPYTDYHSGNNGFSHHSHIDNGYYSHEQDYDDRRGSLRTGNNFHQQNQQARSKKTSRPKRAVSVSDCILTLPRTCITEMSSQAV